MIGVARLLWPYEEWGVRLSEDWSPLTWPESPRAALCGMAKLAGLSMELNLLYSFGIGSRFVLAMGISASRVASAAGSSWFTISCLEDGPLD